MEASFPFPCPLEQTVASALLLLSTSTPSLSPTSAKWSKSDDDSESLFASSNGNSKLSVSTTSSTVSREDGSSPEIRRGRQLHLVAHVAPCNDMMMKVVRKSRSKTFWITDGQKNSSGKQTTAPSSSGSASEATEASSCLSSGSSSVSSGQSYNSNGTKIGKAGETSSARGLKRKPAGSGLLSGRSEAILKLLSNGCCISEVRIRQLLGDSPDTSKALRMLLRREEVMRSGAGGRTDPFIYKKA